MVPLRHALVALVGAAALVGCDATTPTTEPTPEPERAGIQIDQTWQARDGEWTFTGSVDPQGDPTDVVFEIGPGPVTTRVFDQQLPVAQGLVDAGPLSITTRDIPDIDEICVRFAATNSAGTSLSTPLCFPHDLPSFVIDQVSPTTTFSTPAVESTTVISEPSYTVAWTEADDVTGVRRRSLQRRVAVAAGEACGEFQDDGPAVTDPSPILVTGLLDGRCYQWAQSLSDGAGNTSITVSGTVRVDLGGG